jgi:hypothetical protein
MEGTMSVRSLLIPFALAATGLVFACDGSQEKVFGPEDVQPQFAKPPKCDPWPQCQDDGGAQPAWRLELDGPMESDESNPNDAGVETDNKNKFTGLAGFDENSHKVWGAIAVIPETCENPGYTEDFSAFEQLEPFLQGSDAVDQYSGSRVVVRYLTRGETEYRIMVLKKDLSDYPDLGYPDEGVRSFGLYLWGDGERLTPPGEAPITIRLPVSRVVVNPPAVMGGGWFSCDAATSEAGVPTDTVTATFTPIGS